MTIAILVETMWLVQYPWTVEITYDQGGEFLSHEFKIILIEQEYVIKSKPDSSGNPQAKDITEIIHQVLGNLLHFYDLQETYIDYYEPWMGILAAADLLVGTRYHQTKQKSRAN